MPGTIINYPTTVSNYWSQDQQEALYDEYVILPSYFFESGTLQMPVSGQPTDTQVGYGKGGGAAPVPCELIQLSAPWMQVVVGWLAKRLGQPPAVPDPRPPSSSSCYTLLRHAVMPPSPMLSPDGLTYIWLVGGVYHYALRLPINPSDGYQTGAAPFQTLPAAVTVFGAENFRQTIFDLTLCGAGG